MLVRAAAADCTLQLIKAKRCLIGVYRNNSNLIASCSNIGLNSVLLISKLIKNTPKIIPRASFALLSFSGMISINMQGRDWSKHLLDCRLAFHFRTYSILALTAARVCVKGANILLTCSLFAGSLIALTGFPHVALVLFQTLRPISLLALIGTISGEFIDFNSNKRLLKRLRTLEHENKSEVKVQRVAQHFLYFAYQSPYKSLGTHVSPHPFHLHEQRMALDVMRQMEVWVLESTKLGLAAQGIGQNTELTMTQARHVYCSIDKALTQTQAMTTANIGLTALGYLSMGICRIFPQTTLQYTLTLAMSVFYTSKMIYEKHLLKLLKTYAAKS